jgi:predicted RNase H-like HicB family nuclease
MDEPILEIDEFSAEQLDEARRYSILVAWSPRDDAFLVSVPELPGLRTHGRTHQEAVEMAEEAIALWLAGLRATGQPVPEPRFASVPA